jgi:hypothetical protein
MALHSPVVFPLFSIVSTPAGPACGCGLPACGRIGKHPRVKWGELKLGDQVPKPEPGAGAGIKTGAAPYGSNIFVVDLDTEEAYDRFDAMGGHEPTRIVYTPRGYHLYFKHPGFPVKTSAGELGKGMDIRGDRGFVVAPGSPHASRMFYSVAPEHDVEPADAPEWLLTWLRAHKPLESSGEHVGDVTDAVERKRRQEIYAKWLAKDAPPRGESRRGRGDQTLFDVVQYGAYDLALPTDDVLELVREHYDPRCSPPWDDELDERVIHKATWAKEHSSRPRRMPLSAEENEILASVLEPTSLTPPPTQPEVAADDPTCGFAVKWGGWEETPIPPSFIVDGLLLQGKVNMIFADSGSIKSWTAIDLAACVSEGLPWLGERATVQGSVLYIDFEDGLHEFHRRVHLLTKGQKRPNLGYLYQPGDLNDKKGFWLRLAKYQQLQKFSFVIVDTLAGGASGIDENDQIAADPLKFAGTFTEATGATVLLLHHANRSGEIRGTSAFKANVDTLFKLDTISDEGGIHKVRLQCTKSGQRKVLPISLEFSDDGLRRYEEPAKVDDQDDKKEKRTLQQLKAEVLLQIETNGPIASIAMLRGLVNARMNNVNAVVAELDAAGDIVRMEDGWIRDSERARRERLRTVIQENNDWSRGKVLAHAFVTTDYFEQCRAKGLIAARSTDPSVVGFVWINQT